MRVVDERIVHRNRSPNHRPEAISGVTLAWSRLGSSQPVLLCAFRSGSAKMSQDGRIALRSSKDLGRTWEDVPSPFAARPRDPWDQATRRVAGERAADQARAPHDPSLWGTMWGWTFGTPTAVQAPDGSVLITFFAAGFDGVATVRCVRVEL